MHVKRHALVVVRKCHTTNLEMGVLSPFPFLLAMDLPPNSPITINNGIQACHEHLRNNCVMQQNKYKRIC
jgi:hypothetical protein